MITFETLLFTVLYFPEDLCVHGVENFHSINNQQQQKKTTSTVNNNNNKKERSVGLLGQKNYFTIENKLK